MRRLTLSAMALVAAGAALAQVGTTVTVAESDEYGRFLTVDDLPVYLFAPEEEATGGAAPAVTCIEECLDAWPLVLSDGDPMAGEGVMPGMLGTIEHEGQTVVTYDGWPLYRFARDTEGNAPTGQAIESFGGTWHLIRPDGERIEGEGA